jgi:hypothetical protein
MNLDYIMLANSTLLQLGGASAVEGRLFLTATYNPVHEGRTRQKNRALQPESQAHVS